MQNLDLFCIFDNQYYLIDECIFTSTSAGSRKLKIASMLYPEFQWEFDVDWKSNVSIAATYPQLVFVSGGAELEITLDKDLETTYLCIIGQHEAPAVRLEGKKIVCQTPGKFYHFITSKIRKILWNFE